MRARSKILWFGACPTENALTEATNRNLSIEFVEAGSNPDFTNARAAVFWGVPPNFRRAFDSFKGIDIGRGLDEGLDFLIVVGNDACLSEFSADVDRRVPRGPARERVRIKIGVKEHEVLELAARNTPGPALNPSLEIVVQQGFQLGDSDAFFLKRAFQDCKSISLQRLTGGLSGARTYLVEATLASSLAGVRPVPYFVKLDDSDALFKEHGKYVTFAEHHIPWNLRPNFQAGRSVFGVNNGILVGSFVQAAESLWQQVFSGSGPKLIRTLFEETLVGWRAEAQRHSPQVPGSVISELKEFCVPTKVPGQRIAAASQLGEVRPPLELWHTMLDLAPEAWRKSVIHGDMHAENVRVRKSDAIVIDFAKTTHGPICADLASLEVWLVFQIPNFASLVPREVWLEMMERLYSPTKIFDPTQSASSETALAGVESAVLEIRKIAGEVMVGQTEYVRVLSLYLLRHAMFDAAIENNEEDEFRRTYSYWLADRLVGLL